MSTEAWGDYEVPGSPFFVLVDGRSGRRIGEGVANRFAQVADLVRRAQVDAEGSGRTPAAGGPADVPADGPGPEARRPRRPGRPRRAGPGACQRPGAAGRRDPPGRPEPLPGIARRRLRPGRRGRTVTSEGGLTVATLQAHGSPACPPGFEGRIFVRPRVGGERPFPVAHFATFPLPEEVGDFGGGAVTLMRPTDIFAVLFEYGPESLGTPLFARQGMARSLTTGDFRPTCSGVGWRSVGDPVVLHGVRPSVHPLRGPREPLLAGGPGPQGQRPPRRGLAGVHRRVGRTGTGRCRGTDRPLPGGLWPAGGGRGGQGGAPGGHGPSPGC